MILFLVSFLLSALIATLGFVQGRRYFGAYARTTAATQELTAKLCTCSEGVSFREVLAGWLETDDPILRRITHDLDRLFKKEPLRLHGRLGWVVDLDALCDAQRRFKLHRCFGRMEAMPGILTGVGILCTFLGLTIGVFGLDPTNAEQLTTSVRRLLGGMSLAFLTSIAGIGTALWWTWRHRVVAARFEAAFAELSEVLHDKSFLLIPEEMNYQLLDLQAGQSRHLAALEETCFNAFSRALAQSGIGDLKSLLVQLLERSDPNALAPFLDEIKQLLVRLDGRFAENGEINRKLNKALNHLAQKKALPDSPAVISDKLVTGAQQVLADLGQVHQAQDVAVHAIRETAEELAKLMKAARVANNDIINHHQQLCRHLEGLDRHWENYRQQLHTMQATLEETLSGFGENMRGSLEEVHREIDGLLAESLEHFSGALTDFGASIESLAMLVREDALPEAKKKATWLGRFKQ